MGSGRAWSTEDKATPVATLVGAAFFESPVLRSTVQLGATEEWRLRNTSFD
jgi:hypothetical protein